MTILEILNEKYSENKIIQKSLEIIKDNYTSSLNDNYELIIDEYGELNVKIPSLEKKNEFVFKEIGEYEYPLVMCMKITEMNNPEAYEFLLSKFMELYKDKLELYFKDVTTVEKLMSDIKNKKSNIDYITYGSMFITIIGAIFLCVNTTMNTTIRTLIILGVALVFSLSIVEQFTKESQVKKVIDGYLSIIKTEWYRKQLYREYAFLCNFAG